MLLTAPNCQASRYWLMEGIRHGKIMEIVTIIPARSGSKRLANKNILPLEGHPLMAYTIAASPTTPYVTSDSEEYLDIAEKYGAIPIKRPAGLSQGDIKTDIWVIHALANIIGDPKVVIILRPSNPFRTRLVVDSALSLFLQSDCHSLRAVSQVTEHPGKMWSIDQSSFIRPLLKFDDPVYNLPTQQIPGKYYIQNASMEIFWKSNLILYEDHSGHNIIPYITKNYEGYDINTDDDFIFAGELVKRYRVKLPDLDKFLECQSGWEKRYKRS